MMSANRDVKVNEPQQPLAELPSVTTEVEHLHSRRWSQQPQEELGACRLKPLPAAIDPFICSLPQSVSSL